jgi:TFIIF-interacting CTD phosphatase-like protein
MRNYRKKPKRINILLDLDSTIISSITKEEENSLLKPRMKKFRWENMEGIYKVFERPGLQEFLDFLFKNFNVSIWTAASKTYALFVIDKFVLNQKPERKLEFIFFSYHCSESELQEKTQKSLKLLKSHFKLPIFDMNQTYIIDDHPDVYNAQPKNCIKIKPFEFSERKSFFDDELNSVIKPILKKILIYDDME